MYKLITAIGNPNINNEIKMTNKYNVIFPDIAYQEAVIEVIEKNEIDKVVIYEELNGELELYEFIEKINEANELIDIILVVETKEKNKVKRLNNIGVQKIIDVENISIDLLCQLLEENISINIDNKIADNIELEKIKESNIRQINDVIVEYDNKIITVYGNPGSGKTTIATNLSIAIAQNTNKKVLLIDLDTLIGSAKIFLDINENEEIDIYLDEDKKCGINYCVELIQKRIFSPELFNKIVIQCPKEKKFFVLSGNTSMFVCQNILREDYYKEILEMAQNLFDYIVIDTNSNIFLDSTQYAIKTANLVYYVAEPTIKDAHTFVKITNLFKNTWKINMNNTKVILNKFSSASFGDIQRYFNNQEIVKKIEYDSLHIKGLNDGIPAVLTDKRISDEFKEIIGIKKAKGNFTQFRKYIKEVLTYAN